jgi:hypothetical protein
MLDQAFTWLVVHADVSVGHGEQFESLIEEGGGKPAR